MLHHTRAVVRGTKRALVIGDMPFLSYSTPDEATENAGRFMQDGGAQAVKIEGGVRSARIVEALVKSGVPVMGHIGWTPQSQHGMGGKVKVQGKSRDAARASSHDAVAIQEAGAFSIVLELVPEQLAAVITSRLRIPTIGIGAGPHCSGQVQVIPDMLGLGDFQPKHARAYADLQGTIADADAALDGRRRRRHVPGPGGDRPHGRRRARGGPRPSRRRPRRDGAIRRAARSRSTATSSRGPCPQARAADRGSRYLCTSAQAGTPAALVARSSSGWIAWRPCVALTNPAVSPAFAAATWSAFSLPILSTAASTSLHEAAPDGGGPRVVRPASQASKVGATCPPAMRPPRGRPPGRACSGLKPAAGNAGSTPCLASRMVEQTALARAANASPTPEAPGHRSLPARGELRRLQP